MEALDDQKLLASLHASEPEARAEATRTLSRILRGSLARAFASPPRPSLSESDLDDLTQESMTKIMEKLSSFEGRSKFTTWAVSLAVNTALSLLRKRKHREVSWETLQEQGKELISSTPLGSSSYGARQTSELLELAIRESLTDKQREALLAELAGMPLMEIARRMGSQRGTTYKLLHDARRRLLRHFQEKDLSLATLTLSLEEPS